MILDQREINGVCFSIVCQPDGYGVKISKNGEDCFWLAVALKNVNECKQSILAYLTRE